MDYRSITDDGFEMDYETGSQVRSTLADAFFCPARVSNIIFPVKSCNEPSFPDATEAPSPALLSGPSRAIIKQCFTQTNPICLDPGHPTVAFNQDQISRILRIVADESARASFEMLNSVVQRASRLNFGEPPRTVSRSRAQSTLGPETDPDIGSDSVITYGSRRDDSSPGITSEVESRQDFQSSVSLPTPPAFTNAKQFDLQGHPESSAVPSPGAQTLATLKQEAMREKRNQGKQKSTKSKTEGPARPRRRVGQITTEEYFDSMPWTRAFVSGPMNPKRNPHQIYCQICECNVSIRAKVPKEILRHYATERHLRRDQRWRYEYLTIEYPITKRPRYEVRGRDGEVLSNYKLQLGLPHFVNSELVDIGD